MSPLVAALQARVRHYRLKEIEGAMIIEEGSLVTVVIG
jgi:hypothetical protein